MSVRLVLFALLAPACGACIGDERHARDASAETAVCSDGDHRCSAIDTALECKDGAWVSAPCGEGQTCSRTNGRCSSGTLSCLGTLVCDIDCAQDQGDACTKACAASATVPAVDGLGNLNDCQCAEQCWPSLCGKLFPWPTYGAISSCVAAACATEAATCVGGGPSGSASCLDVRGCVLECKGDVFCAEGCFASGDAVAQTIAAFYYLCVRKECGPDPASGCLFTAQADKCADLWAACQAETP